MKTSIVEFLTPDKNPDTNSTNKTKEYSSEEIFDISMSNVANNASWNLTDVLLSTPMTLNHILKKRQPYANFDVNPAIIVVDEIDLLLDSEATEKHIFDILRKFMSKRGPFASDNSKR
jgi:hypothetical protein